MRVTALGVIQAANAFKSHSPVEMQDLIIRKVRQRSLKYVECLLAAPLVFAKQCTQVYIRCVKRLRR
ncbi:MAG: hypothetical protein QOI13_1566 [Paraburkholderia sp.]|jgi:hypothetical protein|nr:hypothetical protein [Paraburkholderia sp.]